MQTASPNINRNDYITPVFQIRGLCDELPQNEAIPSRNNYSKPASIYVLEPLATNEIEHHDNWHYDTAGDHAVVKVCIIDW